MDDEDKPKSFEEALREIADEVQRGIERVQHGRPRGHRADVRRRRRPGQALHRRRGRLAARPDGEPPDMPFPPAGPAGPAPTSDSQPASSKPSPMGRPAAQRRARTRWTRRRTSRAARWRRWTPAAGRSSPARRAAAHGEGPGPSDALGLVRELRVRDWIDADGEVTLVGARRAAALARPQLTARNAFVGPPRRSLPRRADASS